MILLLISLKGILNFFGTAIVFVIVIAVVGLVAKLVEAFFKGEL